MEGHTIWPKLKTVKGKMVFKVVILVNTIVDSISKLKDINDKIITVFIFGTA